VGGREAAILVKEEDGVLDPEDAVVFFGGPGQRPRPGADLLAAQETSPGGGWA
jgi:hypothetical protein